MSEAGKKISFGFNKLTKKQNFGSIPRPPQQKIELIDCLESHTIKLKNACEEIYTPLVIPMTKSNSTLIQRKRNTAKEETIDERPDSELTADELAARELIREAQSSVNGDSTKIVSLPSILDDGDTFVDKEEPTLDDYQSVPVSDYGLAMLRGMGWKEGMGIGKTSGIAKVKEPNLRPKGMGLGANILPNKKVNDVNGEELVLKKGGFAKIIDGKQKGQYCEVQGFDDEAGRIIVKTSLQGLTLALNEFLVIPVTKEEYAKSSKVINNAKFEEYKNREINQSNNTTEENVRRQNESNKNTSSYTSTRDMQDDSKYKTSRSSSDYKSKSRKKDYKKKHYSSSDSEEEYNRKKNKERSKHRH